MNKALEYALNILGQKDYTDAELRQKFAKREEDSVEVEEAIQFLMERSFLDDKRFAENYLKMHPSRGEIRIKFELVKRGVSREIISSIMETSNKTAQVENAREVAGAWIKKKQDKYPDKYKLKANIIAKLSRQGFPYEVICQALEGLID